MQHISVPLYEPLAVSPEPLHTLGDQWCLEEVVQAALALDLFRLLAVPRTAVSLARSEGWHEETAERMLRVLCHLGCLEEKAQGYTASPLGAVYLSPDSFFYYGKNFGEPLGIGSFGADLIRCLRQEPDTVVSPEPSWTPERLRLMGIYNLSGYIQGTVGVCDLKGAASLLDLGGGHGFYSIAFAQKYPHLTVTLYDLPPIAAAAMEIVARFGLEDRIAVRAGNFLHDHIGSGYDAVLCSNVLHKDKRAIVLPKVYEALNPGGTLILRCRIADCPDTLANALSKLYWQVRGGKDLFTLGQWQEFVSEFGFSRFALQDVRGIFATSTAMRPDGKGKEVPL